MGYSGLSQAAWSLALCKVATPQGAGSNQAEESQVHGGRGVTFRQQAQVHQRDDAAAALPEPSSARLCQPCGELDASQAGAQQASQQEQHEGRQQQQAAEGALSLDLLPPMPPLVVPESVATSHWSASCGMTGGAWFDTVVGQKLHALWHEQQHAMQHHERKNMHRLEQMHAQVLQDLARLKEYDLRSVTALVQRHSDSVHQLAAHSEQQQRQQGTAFMEQLTSTASSTFASALEASLEERDKLHRVKVAALCSEHEQRVTALRTSASIERSAAVELQAKQHRQQHEQQVQDLTKEWTVRATRAEQEADKLSALWTNAQKENELLRDEVLISKKEALEWRGKWERDCGRYSVLQREHEHAQHALEEQLAQLQGHHRLELQQRDSVLRRCKDTIVALEAQLVEARKRIDEHSQ